jgi:hypothetical protein
MFAKLPPKAHSNFSDVVPDNVVVPSRTIDVEPGNVICAVFMVTASTFSRLQVSWLLPDT